MAWPGEAQCGGIVEQAMHLPFDDDDLALADVPFIDDTTGLPIDQEERKHRARILAESARGYIAVDRRYHETQLLIHQPLVIDEVGEFIDNSWQLNRANSTILRVTPAHIGDVSRIQDDIEALQEFGVMVARKAVGDAAARLMRILYEMANDPPNWRQRRITVRLAELMDHMQYRKDADGYHRSKNRRHLGQILLALHYTQIGIQRSHKGGSVGAMGPLLSGLEYTTNEDTSDLSPFEVVKRGLPDLVTIEVNEQWYRLRDSRGRQTGEYALVPRTLPLLLDGVPVGRRPNPTATLRAYFTNTFTQVTTGFIVLTRDGLRNVSGLKDSNATRCTQKLARALSDLRAEGVISGFEPGVLPLDARAPIRILGPQSGLIAATERAAM